MSSVTNGKDTSMTFSTGAKLLAVAAAALVLTAGTHAERQLIRTTFLTQPAWSPDGRHVAWVAGPSNGYGTVWVADASGRNARALHQFGHSPLDGVDRVGQIAWQTSTSLLVDAQLSGVVQLFRLNLRGQATVLNQLSDLNFSTDASRRFVATTGFTSTCGHPNCPAPIHILDTATRNVTAVGRPRELDLNPALAPDGRRVAYGLEACPATNCGNAQGVWLAAWRNGTRRQIVRSGAYPVWSPNGELIAYVRQGRHGGFLLEVLRLGGKTRPFGSRFNGTPPAFSPDSRSLAYVAGYGRPGSAHAGVAAVDLNTHRIVRRAGTFAAVDGRPTWSPDGTKLLVAARTSKINCTSLWIAGARSGPWRRFRSCG
jgi:Tol biopolymer transport system component